MNKASDPLNATKWGSDLGRHLARNIQRVLILTLAVMSGLALAEDATSRNKSAAEIRLKPYRATYATTAMGMGMTLTRTLTEEAGRFTLRNEGEILVASLKEVAHFSLADGQIRGEDFEYRLKSLVSRRREVQFLPEEGKIRSLRKKAWTEHEWQPNILDRLSQQEQLRLDLMAATSTPARVSFTVIDGPKVSEKTLELVGPETVTTDFGDLETLHFRELHDNPEKRSSDLWVAPDLDYAMVKTVHNEDGTKIEIKLLSFAFTD